MLGGLINNTKSAPTVTIDFFAKIQRYFKTPQVFYLKLDNRNTAILPTLKKVGLVIRSGAVYLNTVYN